jgi:hypothetical protein
MMPCRRFLRASGWVMQTRDDSGEANSHVIRAVARPVQGGTHGCPIRTHDYRPGVRAAIERKRDQLVSAIGSRIGQLIKKYLPPTRETHWLNDPRRIPQSERAAFLKDLEAL